MSFKREETIKLIQKNDAFYAKLTLTWLNDECLALIKKEIELEKSFLMEDPESSMIGFIAFVGVVANKFSV